MITGIIGRKITKRQSMKKLLYDKEWAMEIIEDKDDIDLIYLIKYNKCGLNEYMNELEYPQLTQYMCLVDYKFIGELGVGFKRTKTLAMGGSFCDFQIRKNYDTPTDWNIERFDDYREFIKLM